MCPKGDDPSTSGQNYRQIRLDVYQSTSALTGKLGIKFMNNVAILNLVSSTSGECTNAFIGSKLAAYVGCTYTYMSASPFHLRYDITFYAWPMSPQENNLFSNNGNPSISDFFCDLSMTSTQTSCFFSDLVNSNIRGN